MKWSRAVRHSAAARQAVVYRLDPQSRAASDRASESARPVSTRSRHRDCAREGARPALSARLRSSGRAANGFAAISNRSLADQPVDRQPARVDRACRPAADNDDVPCQNGDATSWNARRSSSRFWQSLAPRACSGADSGARSPSSRQPRTAIGLDAAAIRALQRRRHRRSAETAAPAPAQEPRATSEQPAPPAATRPRPTTPAETPSPRAALPPPPAVTPAVTSESITGSRRCDTDAAPTARAVAYATGDAACRRPRSHRRPAAGGRAAARAGSACSADREPPRHRKPRHPQRRRLRRRQPRPASPSRMTPRFAV